MFLTHDELVTLTGKKNSDAQSRTLRFMGIEHKPRPDGTLVVLKSHVEQLLGGTESHKAIEAEPDWSMV